MSLINEALKRARSEAQRQAEAERQGVAPAPAWTPPPFSRRERSPILASVAASVGATALILGLGYFLLRGHPVATPSAAAPAPREAAAVPPSVPIAAPVEPLAAAPRPAPQTPAVAPSSSAGTPSVPRPRPSVASTGAAAKTAPVRSGSAGGKTFVRQARLADGTAIELGGIISGAVPLAMLNWKMIGIGEYAGSCSLTKIEAHRVELHGPDGTFWIELQ
ncbi:MAG: hypothetical protein ABI609_01900 [Acidobacteriota bacterium]